MGLFEHWPPPSALVGAVLPAAEVTRTVRAQAGGQTFNGLDDPNLLAYIKGDLASGDYGWRLEQLRNMATLRCVSVICMAIGMLPTSLLSTGPDKAPAKDHPAYRLVKLKPNGWQTPLEFKSGLMLNLLADGHAYARIIWSAGRAIGMVPMDPRSVQRVMLPNWTMSYHYTRPDGGLVVLQQNEVLHIRDLSPDGLATVARMRLARNAIGLARKAERAAERTFETGVMAGGALEAPDKLSDQAYDRMKESLQNDYSGAENAQRWMVLEEGVKANKFATTAAEAQHIENRNAQIEEVARAFGVPRPLLMMDDTSWGSGIEQLGIFFVQYGLAPWIVAWEQALGRSLLADDELEGLQFKFNEGALLRGTLADQAGLFTKALGAGGQAPWMTQNEVRDLMDLARSNDPEADKLRNPMTQPRTGNEPPKPA